MRKKFTIAAIALAIFGGGECGAAPAGDPAATVLEPGLVAKVHFVGTAQLQTDKNADVLNKLGATSDSAYLRDYLLDRLSQTPLRVLKSHFAPGALDYAGKFRPLLEDILREESYLEVRNDTNKIPETLFAVKVDHQRAELWRTSLSTVLGAWTSIPVTNIEAEGFKGWELRKHHDPNLIRFFEAGDWVVFGWGWNELSLQSGFLQRIKAKGRPTDATSEIWLDAWLDWPRFLPSHPWPVPASLPKMHLTLEGRQTFIRPKLVMQFPTPLGMTLDPWRIPTNTACGPYVSFSAARGIAPWLNKSAFFRTLGLSPTPNQFTAWASQQGPFETFLAVPVANATNTIERIQAALISSFNSRFALESTGMKAVWLTNKQVLVTRFPFITPNVMPVREAAGDFLVAGAFAVPHSTNSPPRELMEQFARSNLVYYGVEDTDARLKQVRPLVQLSFMARQAPLPETNTPGMKWLMGNGRELHSCATMITLTGPNELTLLRNSTVGLTASELSLAAYLLDAPGFPLDFHYQTAEEWYKEQEALEARKNTNKPPRTVPKSK